MGKLTVDQKDKIGKWLLAIWVPIVVIVISAQMFNHLISLPSPDVSDKFTVGLSTLVDQPLEKGQTHYVFHFISQECSCTAGLLKHLWKRSLRDGFQETVFYLGHDPIESLALKGGFKFKSINDSFLKSINITAVPLLIVLDASKRIVYSGGYFRYPAAVNSLDVEILQGIKDGNTIKSLPLFGCATDPELQKALDPLGIIY